METTTILIVASGFFLILVASVLIPYVNLRRRFAGYSEIQREIRVLTSFLRGETFRDGDDLVIIGNVEGNRTTIRFSREDNTPGVNLRMEAPVTFDLVIVPKSFAQIEGGQPVRTGDEKFDYQWKLTTKDRVLAKMFLASQPALQELPKLCCSTKTFLHIDKGYVELSELTVPEGAFSRHLMDHLQSMVQLAKQLALMPGASRIKIDRIVPPRPTSRILAVVITVIAICTGIGALANYQRASRMRAATSGFGGSPEGIPPSEALHIPKLEGWRLSVSTDFDPDLVQWIRNSGAEPRGRLEGNFFAGSTKNDTAYLLTNAQGTHRLVVLTDDTVRFDSTYPSIVLIAKVPKSSIRDFQINMGQAASGETDGILLVRNKADLLSGIILSFNGNSPVISVPSNYKSVPLK